MEATEPDGGAFPDVPAAPDIGNRDPLQTMAEAAVREELERPIEPSDPPAGLAPTPGAVTAPSATKTATKVDGTTEWMDPIDAQSRYGPYRDYVLITTPYGEYAVEPGHVMHFEQREWFNPKEGRTEVRWFPVYTKVNVRDPRQEPNKAVVAAELVRSRSAR